MIFREYYSRIQQMILDDGKTWDLSPKDREALRFVLGLVNSMASELADMIGLSVPTIIGRHGKFVESAQARFGTGIGRATWSTGDEETGRITITETDQGLHRAIQPEPTSHDARSLLNDAIDRICTEEGKKALRVNRPVMITETDGASNQ